MISSDRRSLGEFELIRRCFVRDRPPWHVGTRLGIGDDCALFALEPGEVLAVTADTLVAGVHFFSDVDPADLGYKSLAVNLSDLAACGAEPRAVTLCLTVPEAGPDWLDRFAAGLFELADRHHVDLIGGDTTRGPLSVTIQAFGAVPGGNALRRSGARCGDRIFVTGTVGSAGLGLRMLDGRCTSADGEALLRLLRPEPRVDFGLLLRRYASSCVDVSDGLAADLGHVLTASAVGAAIDWDELPLSPAVVDYISTTGDWSMPLHAGDDYELCFTVPEARLAAFTGEARAHSTPFRAIGRIEEPRGLRLRRDGRTIDLQPDGFDHFA
ncbi:MAG: thiamine-phosphate kinase [Methylotetracoccus sp.]